MRDRLWKVLDPNNRSTNGGSYQWTPGEWTHRIDDPVPCERGWHLCRDYNLIDWLGPNIWRVEVADDAVVRAFEDKIVTSGPVRLVEQLQWDESAARRFVVECAVDALTRADVTDERAWDACDVAFRYACGDATADELEAARKTADEALREAATHADDSLRAARSRRALEAAWVATRNTAASWSALEAALWARDAAYLTARWDDSVALAEQNRRLLWWMGVADA